MTAARTPARRPLGHVPPVSRTAPRAATAAPTRTRILGLLVALLVASAVILLPAPQASAEPVSDWLSWVNNLRASHGLAALQLDGEESALAQQRADINANNGGLAHTPSLHAGVTANWTKLGENVGMGPSVAVIGNAFINSPEHLHNLLDPAYNAIGIGVTFRGSTMYVTHRFIGISAAAVAPAPAPAPKPAPAPTTTVPRPVVTAPPTTAAPAPKPAPVAPTPPPAAPGRVAAVLDALRQLG